MVDYSMNVGSQGIEMDRSCDEMGFDNVEPHVRLATTEKPTVPYDEPTPMQDATIRTSNTQEIEVGPSASDITARTR